MSMALANKKRPNVCLDFFYKNSTEISPPRNPANRGMYLWYYYPMCLLKQQRVSLNKRTKLPTKRPNLIESFPKRILNRFVGLENILFRLKTVDIPLFIK